VHGLGTGLQAQLAAVLRGRILRGVPPPGGRLPTEGALVATFGLSLKTVRNALRLLAEEGFVRARQGSGTYVSDPLPRGLEPRPSAAPLFTGFLDDLLLEDGWAEDRRAERRVQRAPPEAAAALGIPAGGSVVAIGRVRGSAAGVYGYSEDFMPEAVGHRISAVRLRRHPSLLAALVHAGFEPRQQVARVEPGAALGVVARRLDVPAGTPVLVSTGTLHAGDGRPLNFFRLHIREGYGLQMQFVMVGDPQALARSR